jgi:hypothetical protein
MKNLGVCARRVPEEDSRLDQFIGRDLLSQMPLRERNA